MPHISYFCIVDDTQIEGVFGESIDEGSPQILEILETRKGHGYAKVQQESSYFTYLKLHRNSATLNSFSYRIVCNLQLRRWPFLRLPMAVLGRLLPVSS